MKKTTIFILSFLLNISLYSQNKQIDSILSVYQESYNNRKWEPFAESITDSFDMNISKDWPEFSIVGAFQLFTYPNIGEKVKKIQKIKILNNSINETENSYTIKVKRYFSKYTDSLPIEFVFIKNETGQYKLNFVSSNFKPKYTSLPACSYSPAENFNKLKIRFIYPSKENKDIIKLGDVLYTKDFESYVAQTNDVISLSKKSVKETIGLDTSLTIQYFIAATNDGFTNILIDDDKSNIKWLELGGIVNKDSSFIPDFEEDIYTTYIHEFTETTLFKKCGILLIYNRWYTDGLSEYMGYVLNKKINPKVFQDWYINGRYNKEYLKYKGQDNLLDWAVDIEFATIKPLVGEKYTFDNNSGQYGRALQFFVEFVEQYGFEPLKQIHLHFEGREDIVTQEELLDYITKITGEDIKKRIEKY